MIRNGHLLYSAIFLLACIIGACAGTSYVPEPPPPAKIELTGERPGPEFTWLPGHWEWNGRRYTWLPGGWAEREQGNWVAGQWLKQPRGWVWIPGHWE